VSETPEQRIEALGLRVPEAPAAVAAYVPAVVSGHLVFVSGQLPMRDGELSRKGLVGSEIRVEDAVDDARQAGLNAIAQLRAVAGDLSRIRRIVKVTVFVASSEGFHAQPQVANGASELFVSAFGDSGKHARSAVGVAQLPLGAPVEVEVIAELGEAPSVFHE
jgi:enamine deaminase RidA (YjgF/YER057c/UK114 family)